jgi:hypothetical protein
MNGHVWNWKLFSPVNVGCNRWIKSCMPNVTKHNLVVESRLPQTSKYYRKCPCTENTQFLPRNLAPTPHILQLKFYGGSESSRHYEIMADSGNYVATWPWCSLAKNLELFITPAHLLSGFFQCLPHSVFLCFGKDVGGLGLLWIDSRFWGAWLLLSFLKAFEFSREFAGVRILYDLMKFSAFVEICIKWLQLVIEKNGLWEHRRKVMGLMVLFRMQFIFVVWNWLTCMKHEYLPWKSLIRFVDYLMFVLEVCKS